MSPPPADRPRTASGADERGPVEDQGPSVEPASGAPPTSPRAVRTMRHSPASLLTHRIAGRETGTDDVEPPAGDEPAPVVP